MQFQFIYTDELNSFIQILILAFTLSLPVCYIVESLKSTGIADDKFYFTAAILISVIFGSLFSLAFSEMNAYESLWLMILIWMGSQGFYEYLKKSDNILGRMFISLADRIDGEMMNYGEENEPEEEKTEESLIFPVNYIGISTAFSAFHPAVDFGFSNSHGGKFQPIIAPCDMKISAVGESPVIGRYIRAHATVNGEDYTFRFIHMSATNVSKGQTVKKGEKIGKMGNTGSSAEGYHLHFDIWKGHTEDLSSSADRYKKSVDALNMCVLSEGQTVGDETDKRYTIRRV